jgi:hypothetical protein
MLSALKNCEFLKFHLKRVIVTPVVYRLLAPLDRSLKYRHWTDVTGYTRPCGLAAS